MVDQIEDMTQSLTDIASLLRTSREVSLEVFINDLGRKALLMACASYFEHVLTKDVQSFFDDQFGSSHPAAHVVRVKAISRQYHTWFDWDKSNANKFFGMFGAEFSKWMQEKVRG
ncbi:hypothetical protein HJB88_12120 [Rhizobium sp. NZLR5]|uniref:hypothetical protein n=1 Tax=Rhizobium sp. NZLR5 TaxID=2731103 RepID=UPI001C82F77C|nr:hypothetical protein [Rhizobium sp. NZLR5]MBX5183382.1 hypothetical protein [Rhizobium sp. NZLR5]